MDSRPAGGSNGIAHPPLPTRGPGLAPREPIRCWAYVDVDPRHAGLAEIQGSTKRGRRGRGRKGWRRRGI